MQPSAGSESDVIVIVVVLKAATPQYRNTLLQVGYKCYIKHFIRVKAQKSCHTVIGMGRYMILSHIAIIDGRDNYIVGYCKYRQGLWVP